ncbi:MAG: hypothetical protein IIY16_06885 [Oscillospiraceae bacterium]|nr:hypothetical protein [Oscillospiraceae bacterium]
MAETCPAVDLSAIRETACIHTAKITDSFRDKDCIEDLRVYLTRDSQCALDCASGARARYAELLHVGLDVASVPFHKGHYSVDVTYYYRILADALMGNSRPVPIFGLAVFSKRIVMFGGDCGVKVFTSESVPCCENGFSTADISKPEAVIEAVDPMILAAKLVDTCTCCRCDAEPANLPDGIFSCFESELVLSGEAKRLYITLGQFSLIRMQRETQLSIPAFDYCIPTKEFCDAPANTDESAPCDVFNQVEFPVESFFPTRKKG